MASWGFSTDASQTVCCLPQLTDVIVEMASNMMLVDDHVLWMAQIEDKACTSIVHSLEKIASYTLSSNSQHVAVVSIQALFGWGAGEVLTDSRRRKMVILQVEGASDTDSRSWTEVWRGKELGIQIYKRG